MNNTNEIYQWLKEHEDNTVICYRFEKHDNLKAKFEIKGFKFELDGTALTISFNNGGSMKIDITNAKLILDKNDMDYSGIYTFKTQNDTIEYDMQLINENSITAFVIVG